MNLLSINWNQKKNIIFQINDYYKQEFTFSNNDTLDCLLRTYLHKIDYDKLKDNINDIKYFYNSRPIQFIDHIRVGEFFLHDNNPLVTVIDKNNIIKLYTVSFKTTQGNMFKIFISYKRTIEQLVMKYLFEIKHPELMDKIDKIQFLYNARQIKLGDATILNNFF